MIFDKFVGKVPIYVTVMVLSTNETNTHGKTINRRNHFKN